MFFNHFPFFPVVAYLIDRGRFPGGVYFRVLQFTPSSSQSADGISKEKQHSGKATGQHNRPGAQLMLEAAQIPFTALFYHYRSTMRVIVKQYTPGRIARSLFLGDPFPYERIGGQTKDALEAWQVIDVPTQKQVCEIGQQWENWFLKPRSERSY